MLNQLQSISPEDYIYIRSYDNLCYHYSTHNLTEEPPPGPIICYTDEIHELFHRWNRNRYVVFSPASDFGLEYQDTNHPNKDLIKCVDLIPWQDILNTKDKYYTIPIGPTCEVKNCRLKDRYSVKCYTYTKSTFNKIPDNIIHWYCVNNNIIDTKVSWLPFGMCDKNGWHESLKKWNKEIQLYVNFQNYTHERLEIKNYYSKMNGVVVGQPNLRKDEYLKYITQSKLVMSPFGNGLDCYRNYESWYLGSIPVTRTNAFTISMSDKLPIILVEDLKAPLEYLNMYYNQLLARNNYQFDVLKLSYWKDKIDKLKKEYGQS